jgi:4-hydroxybenzoate polyprenyltransferase
MAVIIAMLVWEHAILRPSDLSRLNVAFFNLNGYVSVIYFAATLADVLIGK